MFEETARKWIREMSQEGTLQRHDQEFLRQLTNDYARRLEEIFYTEVKNNLEKSGKAEEFERMLLYDSQYINKYLNQSIPGYPGFQTSIFDKAKKIIVGF
jgi:predicted aminopeptidase